MCWGHEVIYHTLCSRRQKLPLLDQHCFIKPPHAVGQRDEGRGKESERDLRRKSEDKAIEGGLSLSEGRERGKIVLLKDRRGGLTWKRNNVKKPQPSKMLSNDFLVCFKQIICPCLTVSFQCCQHFPRNWCVRSAAHQILQVPQVDFPTFFYQSNHNVISLTSLIVILFDLVKIQSKWHQQKVMEPKNCHNFQKCTLNWAALFWGWMEIRLDAIKIIN